MKLTPRLQAIADFIEKGSKIADIGTDHGYIPVYLVKNRICPMAIAADINEGPLNNAVDYIDKNNLSDKIEARLGSGLEILKEAEVDTAIIAGMGGLLIRDILEEDIKITRSIDRFILQPMVASDELRRYLYNNGYRITDEKLAREKDRFYEIMVVEHGEETIDREIYYEVGKKLVEKKDKLLKEFIDKKLYTTEKILKSLENRESIESNEKYEELKKRHNDLLEVIDIL
ncbi:tRNA (adenine(22)-N(1))-methyltransferase [Sporosalibacterium faouarense]|uniref:tRNA (adenine(22)-N(1))-methyltransferase n=1 Tax=Sporosalibacterium faouarense TaxID=516123 RepID=UPI00192C477A|nr:tRNA (adenine(22)-N(1))-methyltransferase TrmK [Sporosalibacterium faouarense]